MFGGRAGHSTLSHAILNSYHHIHVPAQCCITSVVNRVANHIATTDPSCMYEESRLLCCCYVLYFGYRLLYDFPVSWHSSSYHFFLSLSVHRAIFLSGVTTLAIFGGVWYFMRSGFGQSSGGSSFNPFVSLCNTYCVD